MSRDGNGSFKWRKWAAVAGLVLIAVVVCAVVTRTTSITEADKLNRSGLQKLGRQDYSSAIADYTAALNQQDATVADKAVTRYYMAMAKKATGDTNGAIADLFEGMKSPAPDMVLRCMSA